MDREKRWVNEREKREKKGEILKGEREREREKATEWSLVFEIERE